MFLEMPHCETWINGLTSDTTVWDQNIFINGRLVSRHHIVDFGINRHLLAAIEDFGLDCRILLHQTVNVHLHLGVIGLLDTKQDFVLGIIQREKSFQVLEQWRVGGIDQRLQNAHAGYGFFRELWQVCSPVKFPFPEIDKFPRFILLAIRSRRLRRRTYLRGLPAASALRAQWLASLAGKVLTFL